MSSKDPEISEFVVVRDADVMRKMVSAGRLCSNPMVELAQKLEQSVALRAGLEDRTREQKACTLKAWH